MEQRFIMPVNVLELVEKKAVRTCGIFTAESAPNGDPQRKAHQDRPIYIKKDNNKSEKNLENE